MRFVSVPEPGVVELNYTWLPTWIGMNNTLKEQIEQRLGPDFVGRAMTEEVLDELHQRVVALLVEMHPGLPGLRDYLDAIKYVTEQ